MVLATIECVTFCVRILYCRPTRGFFQKLCFLLFGTTPEIISIHMRTILFSAFCLVLVGVAHADDKPAVVSKALVSIKVVQVADAKADVVEVTVTNASKDTIVVDRQALQEPDFKASKDESEKGSEEIKELHMDRIHGSTGGHWSLAQLQRREPQRVIIILPDQTFTTKLEVHTLLRGIDEQFQHGDIQVAFGFHDLILAVGGTEADVLMYGAVIHADKILIHRP